MDKDFALRMASEIGIDVQQVIREEAELIFLKGLFDSSISDKLVFKGGTALRLLYDSPRFSEDLDFSITNQIELNEFKKIITNITKLDNRFFIKDIAGKYYTFLAQIGIKEPWQNISLSMKIEISKRIIQINQETLINVLAKSSVTNISVLTKTLSLEAMLKEKHKTIEERKMPRDIFDIWYICQKTAKPFTLKNFGYKKGKIRQELRKFLPKRFYPAIEDLEELNAQTI